jgi:hypothetical protein
LPNIEGRAAGKINYHTIVKQGEVNVEELAGFLARRGQFMPPLVGLIEQRRLACDELIDVTVRARCCNCRRAMRSEVLRNRASSMPRTCSSMTGSHDQIRWALDYTNDDAVFSSSTES